MTSWLWSIMGVLAGVLLGALSLWLTARRRIGLAKAGAAALVGAAERRAASMRHVAELEARERAVELTERQRAEVALEHGLHKEIEVELDERDLFLQAREQELEGTERELDKRQERLRQLHAERSRLDEQAADIVARRLSALETKAQATATELRGQLVDEAVARAEHAAQRRLRTTELQAQEAAVVEARRTMAAAIERYSGVGHLERVQNTITVEDAGMLRTLGDSNSAAWTAFAEESGCELLLDEEARALVVRGDDPLAREVARRALKQLVGARVRTPDGVRKVARQVKSELEREVHNAGKKAVRLLDIGRVHPEVLHLVGRLKFRLSYSQNQWKHSVEVAYMAGMMAEELGLDARLARRGGLLHDIGKAMTHDHEGSHAVLGAEVARRCGELEIVANAIGSHHNDEPPETAIANIVTAADAISGARPGARRESATQYLARLGELQRIAGRSPWVRRVDIMQAGREVRVVIASDELDDKHQTGGPKDADVYPLAQEIARAIEEELTFAGQIRVTVIRESRAVSVAR